VPSVPASVNELFTVSVLPLAIVSVFEPVLVTTNPLKLDPVRVVNAPVPGVVEPIEPGDAKVAPLRVEALIVPVPVKPRLAPLPTTIAAVVSCRNQ